MNSFGGMIGACPPGVVAGAQGSGDENLLSSTARGCVVFEMGREGGGIHVKAQVAPWNDTAPYSDPVCRVLVAPLRQSLHIP